MEIKLFGKSLFEVTKKKSVSLLSLGQAAVKESKFLPDFYKGFESNDFTISSYAIGTIANSSPSVAINITEKDVKKVDEKKITPKDVFTLKMLHDEGFKLKTDPAYIDEQLASFGDKLALIKSEEYDMTRGVKEIGSIVVRFENRKKYPIVKDFFEQFPYTTTARMEELVTKHGHLKIGQIAQFLADMPKEAADTMKSYNASTAKVCGKQAVYYIIAEKKDFEKTTKRRNPILLAQSPFGHFWQILGAWDKEMLLVDEL